MNWTQSTVLKAGNSGPKTILQADDGAQGWRIIEAWSRTGLPWDMVLEWSRSGGVTGVTTIVSVAHAVRVCVYAAALSIGGTNRTDVDNPVGATVADGCMPTSNTFDVWGSCDGTTPFSVQVPPFAHRVAIMLAEPAAALSTTVTYYSGTGARVVNMGIGTPDYGLVLGVTDRIEILTPVATDVRATFFLSL